LLLFLFFSFLFSSACIMHYTIYHYFGPDLHEICES
jgi:hypothetical protein